jgi:hypothetical protein
LNFRERFGCFFLAVGLVGFLLFAAPVVRAFLVRPESVPLGWLAAAAGSPLILWAGWRLHAAGRRAAQQNKPASLGARLAGRRSGGAEQGGEESARENRGRG